MVLTDRQRADLHGGIYEYLLSRPGEPFAAAAAALAQADPGACQAKDSKPAAATTAAPLLEKKWTAVPRLQKKVLELERAAAQSARIHAHRAGLGGAGVGGGGSGEGGASGSRRMIPRPPAVHTLKGHQGQVTCVAVHPVYTVAVSGSEDGTVKVWDHESGDYVRTLKGHTNTVYSVAFTPTGSHLATCSSDLSIKLWDFSTYACVRTLRGHDHTISCVRFIPLPPSAMTSSAYSSSSSSATAAAGGDAAGGAAEASSSATGIGVGAAAGSAQLVSASRDQTVKFWDVETGFCVHTVADHSDWVRTVAVRESDGEVLATSGNDTVVNVYRTGGDRRKVCELRGHEHVVEAVAFVCAATPAAVAESGGGSGSGSGSGGGGGGADNRKSTADKKADELNDLLASCGRDRTVRLWSISKAACLVTFDAHENWVRSVLVHPTGNFIISAGDDRSVRVFDVKSKRCLRTIDDAHPHFVTSIAMHHTLPIMVSGGVDHTVKCWQLD